MIGICIRVDSKQVEDLLKGAERQIPYAMSLGLNRLANIGQAAEQAHMRETFHLRRETFVVRGIKISKADRATKTSWRVVIQLAYPDNRHFMDIHEPGGERRRHGGRYLWQPNTSVFKSKIIGSSNPLSPKNLKMHKTAAGQMKGEQRTFMIKTKGQRLVLQRVDRKLDGRSARGLRSLTLDNFAGGQGPRLKRQKRTIHRAAGTRLLYRLVDRVKIPARLAFVPTIVKAVQAQRESVMAKAAADALRTAR